MKISCDVVTDLLPLYHDGVCNQSSKKLVAEHLNECKSCRALLNKIGNTTIDDRIKAERQDVIMHQAKALKIRYAQNICAVIFSALLLLGIITCFIVDIAITGTLTWSLIPITACVFAGIIFIPAIKFGVKGINVSLVIYTVLAVPFIIALSFFIDGGLFLTTNIGMAVVSVIYLWGVFAIFKVLKARKFIASALSLLLVIPASLAINFTLSRVGTTSLFDIWDGLTFVIIAVVAAIFFFLDFTVRKKS